MARVTVEQSQRLAKKSKGVRMFNFEPGNIYHVLFLGEEVGRDEKQNPIWEPILYMNPTHNVKKDGKGFEVRCANEKNNVSEVMLRNEDGTLMVDPRTGKAYNDGTCPYCELNNLFSKMQFAKREKFIEENPNASKTEIKEYTKKLFDGAPVQPASQARVFLVALFELNEKGKIQTDNEGNKLYDIMGFKMSEHRFNNKFLEQVDIKRMSIDDENDKGIAWHEYYFKFPKNDSNSKMISGKDLNVSPVGAPVLQSDKELQGKLITEITELNLDELEEEMYVYKLKTLEEMERDIAPQMSLVRENMSEEDIEKAKEQIGGDDVATEEEIKTIMNDVDKGESKFNTDVQEIDVEDLM